jgi:hypothetical protein
MKTVDKKSGSVREVTRVEKKAIASSMFEEPKGLKKVPFDKLMSGSSRGMPSGGEMPAWQGQTMPPGMEKPAKEIPAASPPGAKQPAQEKKGDVLDGIPESAKEGIKKLFNW